MQAASTIIRNASFHLLARSLDKLARLAVMILAARYLDLESFGQFSLAIYVGFFCLVLFDGGVLGYLVREISSHSELALSYYINGLLVRGIYVVISGAAVVAAVYLADFGPQATQCILILALSRVFSSFSLHNYSFFRAYHASQYEMFSLIAEALTVLVLTIGGVMGGFSLQFLCLAWLWASLAGLLVSTYCLFRQWINAGSVGAEIARPAVRKIMQGSLWFGVVGVCSTLYTYGATYFLAKFSSYESTALYSAAYNFVFLFAMIPQAVVDGLYPVAALRGQREEPQLAGRPSAVGRMLTNATRYLALIVIPLAVGASLLSRPIIDFVYGVKFAANPGGVGAADALIWLSWYGTLLCFAYLYGNVLWALEQHRFVALASVLALLCSLPLNLFLIPRYSFIGASVALIITFGVLCVLQLIRLLNQVSAREFAKALLPAATTSALMAGALWLVRDHLPLYGSLTVGVACFLASLLALGILRPENLRYLRTALAECQLRTREGR